MDATRQLLSRGATLTHICAVVLSAAGLYDVVQGLIWFGQN